MPSSSRDSWSAADRPGGLHERRVPRLVLHDPQVSSRCGAGTVSRGYLAKLIGKVSESLAQSYAELFERLPGEPVLNIDETGHKEYRDKFWTWCFRAQQYTLFRIDKSRGSKVLIEVLGTEFNGVLGCDYFSAYRKYMREFDVLVQFCVANLIRDVKFLLTLPGREDKAYGQRVRDALRKLFAVIHRRDQPAVGAG